MDHQSYSVTLMIDHKKPKEQKAAYPLPVELIDQLLAQVENKDAESILGESGLARQLKKMLAERMLTAELSHHLASEDQAGKNHRNGSSPKKVLTPGGELQLDVPRDRLSSFELKQVGCVRLYGGKIRTVFLEMPKRLSRSLNVTWSRMCQRRIMPSNATSITPIPL
jgi:transposase-like protein